MSIAKQCRLLSISWSSFFEAPFFGVRQFLGTLQCNTLPAGG